MKEWERLIRQGIKCHQLGLFSESIQFNHQALSIALDHVEVVFAADPDKAVATVLVSYFNLADNYQALADLVKADKLLQRGLTFLQQTALIATQAHQIEALMRGFTQWKMHWSLFSSTYGQDACMYAQQQARLSEQLGHPLPPITELH